MTFNFELSHFVLSRDDIFSAFAVSRSNEFFVGLNISHLVNVWRGFYERVDQLGRFDNWNYTRDVSGSIKLMLNLIKELQMLKVPHILAECVTNAGSATNANYASKACSAINAGNATNASGAFIKWNYIDIDSLKLGSDLGPWKQSSYRAQDRMAMVFLSI